MGKKYGFTLAEALIAVIIIGVATAIIVPTVKHFMPDKNKVLASKAYNILEEGVKNVVEDSSYDNNAQNMTDKVGTTTDTNASVQKGLANLSVTGTSVPAGQNKFCYLLSQQMNTVSVDCSSTNTFKTSNGMSWEVHTPSDAFQLRGDTDAYKTRIVFDVNGDKNSGGSGPDCGVGTYIPACTNGETPDKYEVGVRYDGRLLSMDNTQNDTTNTCGKNGTIGPTLSTIDWRWHYFDVVQTNQDCINLDYDCISCDSRANYTCGSTSVNAKSGSQWVYTSDPKTGQPCTWCDICSTGPKACGYAAGSKVGNQWVVRDAVSTGDICTPPSHTICAAGYTETVNAKVGSIWVYTRDKDSKDPCTYCNICSTTSPSCGYGAGSKSGNQWNVYDAVSTSDLCTPPSHAICAAGYTEAVSAKVGSQWIYTRDKDSKDTCTYCNICSTTSPSCGYGAGSKSGSQWNVYDAVSTGDLCTPPSHAVCAAGYTETVNAQSGSQWIYTRDKDTKDTCTYCNICSETSDGCGKTNKTCASSSPTCLTQDAKSGQTCDTVCNASYVCGTSGSGTYTTFSNFYYYTYDSNSTAQSCFGTSPCSTAHCVACSNCGTHAGPCDPSMQTCYYYDDYSTGSACTSYTNPNYNPCATYNNPNAIINYLKSMSGSSVASHFTGSYNAAIPGRSWTQFSYSMTTASPSSSDQVFAFYYNGGSSDSHCGDAFGLLMNDFTSDIAQAMAALGGGLDSSQIFTGLSSAKNNTVSTFGIATSGSSCHWDFKNTYSSDCANRGSDLKGTSNSCRGSDDHSTTIDPSVVVSTMLSNFNNYCSTNYNPAYANRCSNGTYVICGSPCDPYCYNYDTTYNQYCSIAYGNPDYLGDSCCNDPCCTSYAPGYCY